MQQLHGKGGDTNILEEFNSKGDTGITFDENGKPVMFHQPKTFKKNIEDAPAYTVVNKGKINNQ